MKSPKRTKSLVIRRAMVVAGRMTCVSLEEPFLEALREIATERGTTVPRLVTSIDPGRLAPNLSSAIRLFVLGYYRDQIAARAERLKEESLGQAPLSEASSGS
jgi:predicted DNA-binding ribbon-helix-helix protein